MHLRDTQLLTDLRLRLRFKEPKDQHCPLAFGKFGEQGPQRLAVFDLFQPRIDIAQRVGKGSTLLVPAHGAVYRHRLVGASGYEAVEHLVAVLTGREPAHPVTAAAAAVSAQPVASALGAITAHHYSAAHPSPKNKAFVEAFKKASGMRPNFMGVAGYDGMHLIYEALKKTGGATDGVKLMDAMKGSAWESPRGPVLIDPETREIVHNIYVRKVEKVDGELYNVEFATFENVKDPAKKKK